MIIRVDRDYSGGESTIKFVTDMPAALKPLGVPPEVYHGTIRSINDMLQESGRVSGHSVLECCFSVWTCFMFDYCIKTHFDKTRKRLTEFLERENSEKYKAFGIKFVDPEKTAFLDLVIIVES
ncbi:Golgin subfamily A member 7/ERF4 [Polychytrium aggregatum]|uniref:Golgin subfamily A member 7/ERF4 n=1 Tax=Polychytrium aggregatum TaxID=110093 RepID=UPI0022FDEE49|nr:Golgin subfamily A member 7/ERF4 [Polychytrium aggregatum]KAI9204067.1 Golgin subfamily A member 7/ERF4 [Polychytrium aggregatum]